MHTYVGQYVVGAEGFLEQGRLLLGKPELLPRCRAVTAVVARARLVRPVASVIVGDLQPLPGTLLLCCILFLDTLWEQHQVELQRRRPPIAVAPLQITTAAAYPKAKP